MSAIRAVALSHCSVPFRNWCLYCPTVLFLSETGVYRPTVLFLSETGVSIISQFCSFQKLVSLLSHCSVRLSLRHWCLYCPAVLFFSETGVFMAPLFCSFQKPVSIILLFCSFQKLVSLWSGGEETVRVLAFLCISKLVRLQPESTLEPTLKVGVLSFMCGWVGAYGFACVWCMCVHAHSCAHAFFLHIYE